MTLAAAETGVTAVAFPLDTGAWRACDLAVRSRKSFCRPCALEHRPFRTGQGRVRRGPLLRRRLHAVAGHGRTVTADAGIPAVGAFSSPFWTTGPPLATPVVSNSAIGNRARACHRSNRSSGSAPGELPPGASPPRLRELTGTTERREKRYARLPFPGEPFAGLVLPRAACRWLVTIARSSATRWATSIPAAR